MPLPVVESPLVDLQRRAGNRAVAQLVGTMVRVQRAPLTAEVPADAAATARAAAS